MKRFSIGSKYEYCPNGNYWQDASGLFDRDITLFCDCPKCGGQFYSLRPINITKRVSKEHLDRTRKWNKRDDIAFQVTPDNMDEVLKAIEDKKL